MVCLKWNVMFADANMVIDLHEPTFDQAIFAIKEIKNEVQKEG